MFLFVSLALSIARADEARAPDFSNQIEPILRKYCAGCHNDEDRDGEFSLESFASLQKGTEHGPALLAGDAENSRMIRVLSGAIEPKMPPEGEARPNDDEIALLRAWIESGAAGPKGEAVDRLKLVVPSIESHASSRPITALAAAPDGKRMAIARFGCVEIVAIGPDGAMSDEAPLQKLEKFPGKVTAVHFSADGSRLATASGVEGLGGVAAIWNVDDGSLVHEFRGHRDVIYDAELSPDDKTLATCSYDKTIELWNAETGERLRTLAGHTGAVFDVAFSPDGQFLASASADDTCKAWRVSDGQRMDTLSQPLKESYCVAFSPDGRRIVSGGADNSLRIWQFISTDRPRVNPMIESRFAHEGAITAIAFTADGSQLVSLAEDRTIKVWDGATYRELKRWENQSDVGTAIAMSSATDRFFIGRIDGTWASYSLPPRDNAAEAEVKSTPPNVAMNDVGESKAFVESEPNNAPAEANEIQLPAVATGVIQGMIPSAEGSLSTGDFDLYRFKAKAGEEWVLEINAARDKSPLDSHVEILNQQGERVERALMQATMESYFTFRGKDSNITDDFRVFKWEEMQLNDYLYANGEVVRLWLHPLGPDSGFTVYPGQGARHGQFDTTPLSHALGEPCYIVRPYPPGTELVPSGLPVFPIYFENDDAADRSTGRDSRLYFTAPADGTYLAKVRDVRGTEGADFKYKLTVRPRQPRFKASLRGGSPKVAPGSAKRFSVFVERFEGFDGPVRVDLSGLPPGFSATTPLTVEAGQLDAEGVVYADDDAKAPSDEQASASMATATAEIGGQEVVQKINNLGKIQLDKASAVRLRITAVDDGAKPIVDEPGQPLEFEMQPGETILLGLRAERSGHDGEISCGKVGAGHNLPFGTIVDNLGLNGLLIPHGKNRQIMFIKADPVTAPQTRAFFVETGVAGGQASLPVILHIRPAAK